MLSSNVKYIGLDVHKEAIAIAVVNGAGKLAWSRSWKPNPALCSISCMG